MAAADGGRRMNKIRVLLQSEKFWKLVRYVFIGGCTTLVNFLVYSILFYLLDIEMNISNTVAVISAIIFAYVANKLFVFRSRCGSVKGLVREMTTFFSARALTMVIEIGSLMLIHTVIGVDEKYSIITKAVVSIVVLLLNYIFSQRIVFKNQRSPR